jgi:cytochrome c oxidase subunit 2
MQHTRANGIVLLLAAVLGAAACSSASHGNSPANSSPATAIANGQSIFQTGRDSDGSQIVAKPPALYPKCAACHRADGSGGVHLPGGAVSADLRYKALVTEQKPPYTLALLERAISTGVDNTGQPLNPVMPHWKLSKRDLHDVAYYVLTKLR